jgi:aerobic carbon-monoxide dehydrogenase medium subunit
MSLPAEFDYHPAQSVDEALALLQQYGDEAKLLAGGHSLLPTMKLRLAQPGHLIDLGRISGLSYVREENGAVAVGAMTTYTALAQSDLIRKHFPILIEGIAVIGDPQVRNRGTIGGSIAHSDPAADMPGMVLALKADILVQSAQGVRTIKADDFFTGMFETALQPNEIITEIRFPIPSGRTGSAYMKLENKASHYAIAGCAAVVSLDTDGTCTSASVVITGAAEKPTRASGVESTLVGKKLDEPTVAGAATHAPDGLEFVEDIHGSKAYRSQMTVVISRRAILRAAGRA